MSTELLRQWFGEFNANVKDTSQQWYDKYKDTYNTVEDYRQKIKQGHQLNAQQDLDFLELLLKNDKNGVASKGQSNIANTVFEKIIQDKKFIALVQALIEYPNAENYKYFDVYGGELLNKLGSTKRPLLFNRACASCTLAVSTVVDKKKFEVLVTFLEKQNIIMLPDGYKDKNWFERNAYLVEQFRTIFSKELSEQKTDEFLLNIFMWKIYEQKVDLLKNNSQSGNNMAEMISPLNRILFGAAGTGKTYNTINHALSILENKTLEALNNESRDELKQRFDDYKDQGRIEFVTFHQSFSYEDFVEGIRAEADDGMLTYDVKPGVFKRICERANAKLLRSEVKYEAAVGQPRPYILIIDEINRGNISRILGELITLIEDSKRAGAAEALSVTLPYSKEEFSVPDNVYIIGTMNSSDRSLTGLDIALRRRFTFFEMPPRSELLTGIVIDGVNVAELLDVINQRIEVLLDRDHCIGHANFMSLTETATLTDLAQVFQQKIIPQLQEYFFDDWSKINLVLNNNGMLKGKVVDNKELFPNSNMEAFGYSETLEIWRLNHQAFESIESFSKIVKH